MLRAHVDVVARNWLDLSIQNLYFEEPKKTIAKGKKKEWNLTYIVVQESRHKTDETAEGSVM